MFAVVEEKVDVKWKQNESERTTKIIRRNLVYKYGIIV